jgi:poly [ADP-ribose] polymerase
MLNLTDVSYGVKGNNKFYQIQVLQRDENFAMFTKWGRIGVKNPRTQI